MNLIQKHITSLGYDQNNKEEQLLSVKTLLESEFMRDNFSRVNNTSFKNHKQELKQAWQNITNTALNISDDLMNKNEAYTASAFIKLVTDIELFIA